MQFCLLNGIKKTDRRLIKRKVLWKLFPMLRYLYWLPELQWQQLELCLELFLPIDYCHSLAIFWEEERFFPWLQCCLYFHAFCIYQMVSACRNRLIKSIYLQKCTVHDKLRTVHFFFVQYYVFSIFQTRSYQWLSFRNQPTTATPNPRTPRTYPQKLFVVTAIPKSIIAIPNNSILIPFIANIFVTNYDLSLNTHHQYTIKCRYKEELNHHRLRQFGWISTFDTLPDQLTAFFPGSSNGKSPFMQLFMDVVPT